jgi:hypothetical protein
MRMVNCLPVSGPQSTRRWVFCDGPHLSRAAGAIRNSVLRPDLNGEPMDESQIAKRLEILRVEHRDLDSAIAALFETSSKDQLQLARLKKRKLRLRDEISMLEDQLIPDIIA